MEADLGEVAHQVGEAGHEATTLVPTGHGGDRRRRHRCRLVRHPGKQPAGVSRQSAQRTGGDRGSSEDT